MANEVITSAESAATTANKSVFSVLSKIDCAAKTEKRGSFTYLSWAWAWGIVKAHYPTATYEKRRFDNGRPYCFDEFLGYLVETTVTIEGETLEMQLPVMDGANKAQKNVDYAYKVKEYVGGKWSGKYIDKPVEAATMFDINTALMRCLVKNLAMFGLGLNIYAGEDLPLNFEDPAKIEPPKPEPVLEKAPAEIMTPLWVNFLNSDTKEIAMENAHKIESILQAGNYALDYATAALQAVEKWLPKENEDLYVSWISDVSKELTSREALVLEITKKLQECLDNGFTTVRIKKLLYAIADEVFPKESTITQ